MKIAALTLSLFLVVVQTKAEVLLDEIRVNLEDALKKVEQAKKQIGSLEENDDRLKKNIDELDSALSKKLQEQKQAKETYNDYAQKLSATGSAKKEFERSHLKDKQELELVVRDIAIVERKLEALKKSKKALEESIEISEDNLSKMGDRTGSWAKNRDHVQEELGNLDKDIVELEKQKEVQDKARLENQQALNRWRKTLATQEVTYQKLDSKYRQALRDAENKAKK